MTLNYLAIGKGFPLVVLHGLFGMLDNWLSFAKRLTNEYPHFSVLLVDLRNHGKSFHHPDMDYPLMANDVASLLEDLQIKEYSLLGHSMGGKVAMAMALQHQNNHLRSVVVADIAPRTYILNDELNKLIPAIKQLNLAKITSRNEIEKHFSSYNIELPVVQLMQKNINRNDKGQFCWKFNASFLENNLTKILDFPFSQGNISNTPVLFLKGEKSDYICEEDELIIQQFFSDYKIEIINNAGHWLHIDNFEVFYSKTVDFLKKTES